MFIGLMLSSLLFIIGVFFVVVLVGGGGREFLMAWFGCATFGGGGEYGWENIPIR